MLVFPLEKGGETMINIRTDIPGAKIQNHTRLSKNKIQETMEKLSSGKRVYSGKVDSAGLAVTTRMTSQIKGNEKASDNIKDGKLLYKTLDGGLESIEEQLQRMRELTVQLRNGTLSLSDRTNIEKEMEQIKNEINHTASTLTYNHRKLLTNSSSASLNGSEAANQRVRFDNLPVSTSPGAQTTVEFWMNWDGKNNVIPFGWNNYSLYMVDGGFGFNTANGNVIGIPSEGLENRWVHVSAVFINATATPSNLEMYINGKKMDLQNLRNLTTSNRSVAPTAYFGGFGVNSNFDFGGQLDDLRIWNGGRTEQEIKESLNQPLRGDESGLIGYWTFDENSGTTTTDLSGNGNNGTFTNGASWGTGVDYLKLHVGANNEEFKDTLVPINSDTLGINSISYSNNNSLKTLDQALNTITKERAKIGSSLNRLDFKESNLRDKINQQQMTRSRIEDADIANESSQMIKQEIKFQSSMNMLQKNNSFRENLLQMLSN